MLTLQTAEVPRTLRSINVRKAAGPDGVCDWSSVTVPCDWLRFSQTSSTHLSPHLLENLYDSATTQTDCNNWPQRLQACGINTHRYEVPGEAGAEIHQGCSPTTLDPHQYTYRTNRSTDDAISTALHTVLLHLEQPGRYARLLFMDYSSAFNTFLPSRLFHKLFNLGLNHNTCLLIKDFLTDRTQSVKMGPHHSSSLSLSTGVPQGCVLSPFLYFLPTTPMSSLNFLMTQQW